MIVDHTGGPDGMFKGVEHPSHGLGDWGSEPHGFELWSTQTNDFKIDTCRFLARHSALLE